MCKYMIHTYPARLWYVNDYLIPSMQEQGIDDIEIWNDWQGVGNLLSFVASMAECGERSGGIWHLQDDVIISSDFAKVTQENDTGIVCGYCHDDFGPFVSVFGSVPARFMWNSFPCIRIPNETAGDFARWYLHTARKLPKYRKWVASQKHDDGFFHDFIDEYYTGKVLNLKPNIVEHVDFLIGGSSINQWRQKESRAEYFPEPEKVEQLKKRLQDTCKSVS